MICCIKLGQSVNFLHFSFSRKQTRERKWWGEWGGMKLGQVGYKQHPLRWKEQPGHSVKLLFLCIQQRKKKKNNIQYIKDMRVSRILLFRYTFSLIKIIKLLDEQKKHSFHIYMSVFFYCFGVHLLMRHTLLSSSWGEDSVTGRR